MSKSINQNSKQVMFQKCLEWWSIRLPCTSTLSPNPGFGDNNKIAMLIFNYWFMEALKAWSSTMYYYYKIVEVSGKMLHNSHLSFIRLLFYLLNKCWAGLCWSKNINQWVHTCRVHGEFGACGYKTNTAFLQETGRSKTALIEVCLK